MVPIACVTLSDTDAAAWSWISYTARTHPSLTSRPAAATGSAVFQWTPTVTWLPGDRHAFPDGKQPGVWAQECHEPGPTSCTVFLILHSRAHANPSCRPPGLLSPLLSQVCPPLPGPCSAAGPQLWGALFQPPALPISSPAGVAAHRRACQYTSAAGSTAVYPPTDLHGLFECPRNPPQKCSINTSQGFICPDSSSGAGVKRKRDLKTGACFTAYCCVCSPTR